MEAEKCVAPPNTMDLTQGEDTLGSQVTEMISGISVETNQPLEEPEKKGDDAVFFTDEDQAFKDMKEAPSCAFDVQESRDESLVNIEAVDLPIPQKNDEGPDPITDKDDSQVEKDIPETGQDVQTDQEKEHKESQSDAADPGTQHDSALEESVSSGGESVEANSAITELQTQPEQSTSSGKDEEEQEVLSPQELTEAPTPKLEPFDVSNERRDITVNGEAEDPDQMSSDELQACGESQDEQEPVEPQQDHNFHVSLGSPQDSKPGYSTLPLPKKSGRTVNRKTSFNHHISAKYNTVSYRKIQRGNTRQKIDEFESMIMHL